MAQFPVNDPAASQSRNSTQCSTLREISTDKLPASHGSCHQRAVDL